MKKLSFALLILFLISCNTSSNKTKSLLDFIPPGSDVIIKINDVESFKNDFVNNEFLERFSDSEVFSLTENKLEGFKDIKFKFPLLLCFGVDADSLQLTAITKYHDSIQPVRSIDSSALHTKVIDSFLIASTSKNVLEQVGVASTHNFEFELLDEHKTFTLLNKQKNSLGLSDFVSNSISQKPFGEVQFQFEVLSEQILVNGIVKPIDSSSVSAALEGNTPQQNSIPHITPNNVSSLISITYSNIEKLVANLNSINGHSSDSLTVNSIFYSASEIAQIVTNNDTLYALKSIDATTTKDALLFEQDVVTTFRNVPIYTISDHELFTNSFYPLMTSDSISNYTVIDDYFVFSNSENALENVIAHYKNGNTLAQSHMFKENMKYLSDESSLLVVSNEANLLSRLGYLFNEDLSTVRINDYGISIFQLVQDDGFLHFNGSIQKSKAKISNSEIVEEFSLRLDADLLTAPQFVLNHRTQQKEIVVQDVNNQLYLISNSGKVLWKKRLNGEILGEIQQVDLYNNGRLQLAFATSNRVYIIDRNGNDVAPFPARFNDKITRPLSVFDYDNTTNYRFLVTQSDALIMYDKNARLVNGFNYNQNGEIKTQPKHYRISGRDYIVLGAGNKMHILNRRGQTRISVSETIDFSGQPIHYYRNAFTTTSSKGELVQVNRSGNVSKVNLNIGIDHYIDATNKTLTTLWENNLNIKSNTYELDFGQYTKPQIFYINDKIYVSTTDLQEQKVYLFDSQAKLISNFPIYGSSTPDLDNIDGDRNLELVTQGDSNTIILYQKN